MRETKRGRWVKAEIQEDWCRSFMEEKEACALRAYLPSDPGKLPQFPWYFYFSDESNHYLHIWQEKCSSPHIIFACNVKRDFLKTKNKNINNFEMFKKHLRKLRKMSSFHPGRWLACSEGGTGHTLSHLNQRQYWAMAHWFVCQQWMRQGCQGKGKIIPYIIMFIIPKRTELLLRI